MTLPDWSPPRKPRRLGLWLPFVAAGIFVVALGAGWFVLKSQVERRMDAARASLPPGWTVDWSSRRVSGFPFRIDVDLTDARVREPSGWGVSAPRLKTEAFIFAPGHWVAVAPDGAVLTRRRGGAVLVRAKVLRASLSEFGKTPPRFSIEGLGLAFATPAEASPFFLRSADEFHLHTKAGPDDQGALYVELDGARAQLTGLTARIADGKPLTLIADGIFDHASAFQGVSWRAAASAWAASGGVLRPRKLSLTAGDASASAKSGQLSIGGDGRLRGELPLTLGRARHTLGAMGAENALTPDAERSAEMVVGAAGAGPVVHVPLRFEAGRTTLGPAALGPAPRVY